MRPKREERVSGVCSRAWRERRSGDANRSAGRYSWQSRCAGDGLNERAEYSTIGGYTDASGVKKGILLKKFLPGRGRVCVRSGRGNHISLSLGFVCVCSCCSLLARMVLVPLQKQAISHQRQHRLPGESPLMCQHSLPCLPLLCPLAQERSLLAFHISSALESSMPLDKSLHSR